VLDGTLDLPPDVYNGLVLTVAKNLPKGASETVHLVAFTPAPRLIQLELAPAGEHKVLVGELALLTETVRPATAIAAEPTTVIRISRNLFRKVLEGFPEAARLMRDRLAERARSTGNTGDLMAYMKARRGD
jgi:hypothetical protein